MRGLATNLADFLLGNSSQDGVELQVLAARQQVVDGVKLRTVAHVLVDLVHLRGHTEEHREEQEVKVKPSPVQTASRGSGCVGTDLLPAR